jgi:protein-disulfide isomerase
MDCAGIVARDMSAPPIRPASKKQQRRASKRDNDAFSREMAVVRESQKRRRRIRNRLLLAASLVVVVALAAGGVGLWFWTAAEDALAGPRNMRSDGILLTGSNSKITATRSAPIPPHGSPTVTAASKRAPSGVVPIDLYLDYGQTSSAQFSATDIAQLTTWLQAGIVTVEIHPVATSTAHARYSARAANAMACVAAQQPDSYLTVSNTLLLAASKAGFAYPSDAGIAKLVKKAGVASEAVTTCITSETYRAWVTAATTRARSSALPNATAGALTTAPLVLVNGTAYTGSLTDATAFETFVEGIGEQVEAAASGGDGSTAAG